MTTGKVQDFITGNGPPFGESSFVTVVNSLPNDHRQHFDGIFIGNNAGAQEEGVPHILTRKRRTRRRGIKRLAWFLRVVGVKELDNHEFFCGAG